MEEIKVERIVKKETFGGVEFETVYRKARIPVPPDTLKKIAANSTLAEGEKVSGMEDKENDFAILGAAFGFCPEFNPRTIMANDYIVCDQDVAVTLRDGTIIYTDIYRPFNVTEKIPCIVSWSYSASVPAKAWTNGRSSVFLRELFPEWPSLNPAIRLTGAARDMRSLMSIREVSVIPRATSICSEPRMVGTDMTLSSGWQLRNGATEKSECAEIPVSL